MTKLYGHAHHLHELEPYYSRHISAMTSEDLNAKSDIAAELAWRDREIARLTEKLAELQRSVDAYNKRIWPNGA